MAVRRSRVIRGLEVMRTGSFAAGQSTLSEDERTRLLNAFGVEKVGELPSLEAAYLLSPPFEGFRDLYYRAGLDDDLAHFADLRAAAKAGCGRTCGAAELDVLALLMYLPADIRLGQPGEVERRVEVLSADENLVLGAPLSRLLEEVNSVLRALGVCNSASGGIALPAGVAYQRARAAREQNDLGVAEDAARAAARLATQQGDWFHLLVSVLAVGRARQEQGDYRSARRLFLKGKRVAQEHELRCEEWRALHDLFALAAEYGQDELAQRYASDALDAYGAEHERLPEFAHDVAYHWARRGAHRRALPVFDAVLSRFSDAPSRLKVLGNLCRSAGATGDAARFERAFSEASQLVLDEKAAPEAAHAMLGVAFGAAYLGLRGLSVTAADCAIQLADQRGETNVKRQAETVLDLAWRNLNLQPLRSRGAARVERAGDRLAERIVRTLRDRTAASLAG